jgi:TANFOR domain-containing protein
MKKLFFLLLAAFLFSANAFSQNSIIVNVQVLPPYSPYLSTYVDQPNKILLTLTNTTTQLQRVRLLVRLTGDNGISAVTKSGYSPPSSIDIPAGQTKPVNLADFDNRNYFDPGNIDLVGITRAAIIQNQALPEGNYTICVRALDFVTGQPTIHGSTDGLQPIVSHQLH